MKNTKIRVAFLLLIISLSTLLTYSQQIFISNTQNRNCTSLNGKWKYIVDAYETGNIGFMPIYKNSKPTDKTDRVEYSFDNAQTLWVPGAWDAQKTELFYYEGSIWYRKMIHIDNLQKDKRYFIYFGAANYLTTVTFNGEKLGEHEGGFTPFCFEVTDLIKEQENFLIVGVNNSRNADQVPAKVTDWYNHGGITRDVKLIETPATFISNYFLALDKSAKRINGKLTIEGESLIQKVWVSIPELNIRKEINIKSSGDVNFSVDVKELEKWSPDNPKLYDINIITEYEEIADRIGFRTVETKGKQILLNGEPVFLKGISLHDENPLRADRCNSVEDARLLLTWAKELGCNFIRLAHYPHQENIIRLADEMGIMLWEELPLYWGIDWKNPKVLETAKKQYVEIINRDYNRASTIIWSIANETGPTDARNEFLRLIAEHVRSMDDTRLLSAACKKDQPGDGNPDALYTLNDPIMEYLDVVSFNEYLGWYGGLPDECREKTISSSAGKPIIVSEFGGGALQGFYADSLTRWSEDFQAYLYRENIAMFDRIDGFAGMTPWILVDFMSPLRQLPDVQDGWNRKGLISEKGKKKKAFWVLKEYYETK